MGFTGNGARFTGDDGFGKDVAFGAEVAGDGITALPEGTYLVIAVAVASGFPANTTGDAIAVGDVIVIDDTASVTPVVGDDVVTLTLTNKCDLSSWSMAFTKEQIDVTTLCDSIKVYRTGKADMEGSMTGVFIAGTTDKIDGDLQEFIDIVRQDGDTSWDRYTQNEEIKLGFFYVNNKTALADNMFVVGPYQMYGMNLGGERGSPQSFDSSFRFAPLVYTSVAGDDITINPTFYRVSHS